MASAEPCRFTATLRSAAEPIWATQAGHPFLRGLADGSLPATTFLYYTRQDAVFLREMNRVFAYGAARAETPGDLSRFARLILETDAILDSLHGRYAGMQGVSAEDLARTRPSAVTYAYSRHLLSSAATDTYPALLAALLPSMWMYDELGKALAAAGPPRPDHPYREWLELHAGPHLEDVTAWLRDSLDAAAPGVSPAARAHLLIPAQGFDIPLGQAQAQQYQITKQGSVRRV